MLFSVAGCAAPIDHLTPPDTIPPNFPTFRARMFTTRHSRDQEGNSRERKAQRSERRHRLGRAHHNNNKKNSQQHGDKSGPRLAYRENTIHEGGTGGVTLKTTKERKKTERLFFARTRNHPQRTVGEEARSAKFLFMREPFYSRRGNEGRLFSSASVVTDSETTTAAAAAELNSKKSSFARLATARDRLTQDAAGDAHDRPFWQNVTSTRTVILCSVHNRFGAQRPLTIDKERRVRSPPLPRTITEMMWRETSQLQCKPASRRKSKHPFSPQGVSTAATLEAKTRLISDGALRRGGGGQKGAIPSRKNVNDKQNAHRNTRRERLPASSSSSVATKRSQHYHKRALSLVPTILLTAIPSILPRCTSCGAETVTTPFFFAYHGIAPSPLQSPP
ncbi:unnamed protein product [Ectocarpus sp. 8 AP-2014]